MPSPSGSRLYTDSKRDLYRDIKMSLTGKEKENSSAMAAMYHLNMIQKKNVAKAAAPPRQPLDFKQLNKYVTWKSKYEKNAKKTYKWPVFQVFLQ